MSEIADTLDMIDRSASRLLDRRELLTPSVRAELAKRREAAIQKAEAERIVKWRASYMKRQENYWVAKFYSLHRTVAEITGRKY